MKKMVVVAVLALGLGLVLAGTGWCITVDGTFDRTEWAGNYTDGAEASSGTNSGYVGPGYGGNTYDIKAIGLKLDSNDLYFGIEAGYDLVNGTSTYKPGDFFLDFGNDGVWDVAIDYIVSGNTVSFNVYDQFDIVSPVIDWGTGSPWSVDLSSNNLSLAVTSAGAYWTNSLNFAAGNGLNSLEGVIDLNVSGLSQFMGQSATIFWTMECNNDELQHTAPVPEPQTLLLMGIGLLGLAFVGRKKLGERA